jgi:uncharacterized protein (DUF1778 family)
MARLSLRLPDSLHELLVERAKAEGVSLNHYLVYTLTRASALQSAAEQRQEFHDMLQRVSPHEAEADLRALLDARGA